MVVVVCGGLGRRERRRIKGEEGEKRGSDNQNPISDGKVVGKSSASLPTVYLSVTSRFNNTDGITDGFSVTNITDGRFVSNAFEL